jgi:hypothetical protein
MNDQNSEVRNNRWGPLLAIVAALVIWGGLLALGAYWAPSGEQAGHDRRKLWVVAATTFGFLAMWGLAIWLGGRRKRKVHKDLDSTDKQ